MNLNIFFHFFFLFPRNFLWYQTEFILSLFIHISLIRVNSHSHAVFLSLVAHKIRELQRVIMTVAVFFSCECKVIYVHDSFMFCWIKLIPLVGNKKLLLFCIFAAVDILSLYFCAKSLPTVNLHRTRQSPNWRVRCKVELRSVSFSDVFHFQCCTQFQ